MFSNETIDLVSKVSLSVGLQSDNISINGQINVNNISLIHTVIFHIQIDNRKVHNSIILLHEEIIFCESFNVKNEIRR